MDRRFWVSALGAALLAGGLVAGAVPIFLRLEPRGGLRLQTPVELWLLGVFTLGTVSVLLGLSVAVGGWFAPSVTGRAPERPRGPPEDGSDEEGAMDPAWWVTAVGALLLALYGLGWLALG